MAKSIYYRDKCSWRNEGFKVSVVDTLYAIKHHTVQNKQGANQFFHSLKTINSPAIVSTNKLDTMFHG